MDNYAEQDIRWEKVEECLETGGAELESALTEPEREALLLIRRARARLRGKDGKADFPVGEGWQRLIERIDGKTRTRPAAVRSLYFRRWAYAVAAVLLIVAGASYWWMRQGQEKPVVAVTPGRANLPPSRGVQLVLADGRRVDVSRRQSIKEQDGVGIRLDSAGVEYQTGARPSAEVMYNTLEVPRGNKTRVVLPDGTKVWINAASRLRYPTVFAGSSREVEMDGEAYFEVARDADHPFIVHVRGMSVRVLATAFNVNTYDPQLMTTLEGGMVQVLGRSAETELRPGEQARYDAAGDRMERKKVDTRLYTSWKDGVLYMEDAPFGEIARSLGRSYDYDLLFGEPELARLHFTVDMRSPSNLQEVLDHITSTTEGVRFEISGRQVKIVRNETEH